MGIYRNIEITGILIDLSLALFDIYYAWVFYKLLTGSKTNLHFYYSFCVAFGRYSGI